MTGKNYRVVLVHPRRPCAMVSVSGKDGRVIALAGETCENATAADLASLIANGYVEVVPDQPVDATPEGDEHG